MAIATVKDQNGNAISNAAVNFIIDGVYAGTVYTDASGNANMPVGPYGSTHTANVTATINSLSLSANVKFLDRNNLFLFRYPSANQPVQSYAEVDAVFYSDLGNSTYAAGVPLTFTAYDPYFSVLGTYSGVTDASGTVRFFFNMSPLLGNNTVVVSNSNLGGTLKTTVIVGEGGDVSNIIISSNPASPVLADGTSGYTLTIQATDSGYNPVRNKHLTIVKNQDINYSIDVTTNNNGYATVNIPPSIFVRNDVYTVTAQDIDSANNSTKYVNNSITLGYIPGPATVLSVIADPNAVANANVTTPGGAYDVHSTDIITTITDAWGHPISGQTVNVASLNSTLGSISGPTTGVTSDSGEFTTQFTLNASNRLVDTTMGVPVRATSGSLSGTCYVLYTDDSFLSIKSSVYPKYNISVNDTINVNITVRGIGWKIRGQSYDIALIFDSSGSMDWLSTTIYPTTKDPVLGYILPETGTMSAKMYSTVYKNGHNDIDPRDWHFVDDYTYHGNGSQSIEIMFSSSYRNYSSDNSGTCYYLMVNDSAGDYWSTYVGGTNYDHSANENYVIIPNPVNGRTYHIYGAYIYNSAMGGAPYNMMVLTEPKRLGQKGDVDSAAKVAASLFVNNMTNNRVSIVWFNTSSKVASHLKTVDSTNKTIINNAINGLGASGGTQIALGINSAIAELTGPYSNSSNKKAAILLSDGYSQSPGNDIAAAYTAKNDSITIFTIGMGMPDMKTLGDIANITGGTFNMTTSAIDLQYVYGNISQQLNQIVANKTDMHIITNCTYINGTLYPDAVYVPGSAYVKYPNGTVVQQDPSINSNGTYDLRWNPGVIKLNDTWTLNYQLRVIMPGPIQPITNQSYINFTREDGSNDSAMFTTESLFVNGTSPGNLSLSTLPGPNVTILSPLPKTGYNTTPPTQKIAWQVNYTGNYSYNETITQIDSSGTITALYPSAKYPAGTFDGNSNRTFSFDWDSSQIAGDYSILIIADDHHGDPGSDSVLLRIRYANGQIILV
ncbi:MAG TPA: VWA domain-containing protein [Methanocella sp.]|uniref:VWA domain-containing protein n=1 Tax=Methanocella sp. TaxID=2052833 RepID=UPI002B7E6159|nr:VWA domain-containing protein [Methanocella sp.]HTY91827.1 VWA domain-containing protein [Methanocella sp.]